MIIEDFLRNAPDRGAILVEWAGDVMVDELPEWRRQEILDRVVLMQADSAFVLEDLLFGTTWDGR